MLASSPWVTGLNDEQLDRIKSTLVARTFPANAIVCRKGDPVDAWVGVVDGLIKLNAYSQSGKCVTFTGAPTGSWVGEGSVFKREKRQYDIVTLRDSCIAFLPSDTFHWLLDTSLSFNRFIITQLNERLGQMIGTIETERLLSPDGKVARSLASLFNHVLYPGAVKQLQISQEELGFLAGASRQRVNQALRVLEKEKLVKVEYGAITVLDVDGLRAFES